MTKEMSDSGNDRIKQGGNMAPWEILFQDIDGLYEEANNWASDGFVIESQEQADEIDVLDKLLLKKGQETEAERVGEKAPYDALIDEIQSRYNPYVQKSKGKVDVARSVLKQLLTTWRNEQDRIKREAADKARHEAEEERRKAEEAMRSSSGNLAAREQAEQQLEAAKQAESFAKKADKAATTGTGLRTTWEVSMTDQRQAVATMWKANPQEFLDLAQDLAEKAVRAGTRSLGGFEITEKKVAR